MPQASNFLQRRCGDWPFLRSENQVAVFSRRLGEGLGLALQPAWEAYVMSRCRGHALEGHWTEREAKR